MKKSIFEDYKEIIEEDYPWGSSQFKAMESLLRKLIPADLFSDKESARYYRRELQYYLEQIDWPDGKINLTKAPTRGFSFSYLFSFLLKKILTLIIYLLNYKHNTFKQRR